MIRLQNRRGFTLVEVLLVVGLIALLMSILIPVVSGVRRRGFEMRTRSQVQKLQSACQVYYTDWHAYPGPLPDSQLYGNSTLDVFRGGLQVTSTENLTLALLGFDVSKLPAYGFWTTGPVSLNAANPKQYHAYVDYVPAEMDWAPNVMGGDGTYVSQYNFKSPPNKDSIIPEFIDGYSEPKPILYLRARRSAPAVIDADDGSDPLSANKPTQYSRVDVLIYTGQDTAGQPGDKGLSNDALRFGVGQPQYYQSWYDAFRNEGLSPIDAAGHAPPNITEVAKGRDGFLLIGAGPSRIWLGRDAIFLSN